MITVTGLPSFTSSNFLRFSSSAPNTPLWLILTKPLRALYTFQQAQTQSCLLSNLFSLPPTAAFYEIPACPHTSPAQSSATTTQPVPAYQPPSAHGRAASGKNICYLTRWFCCEIFRVLPGRESFTFMFLCKGKIFPLIVESQNH